MGSWRARYGVSSALRSTAVGAMKTTLWAAAILGAVPPASAAPALATAPVQALQLPTLRAFDGVVQAQRMAALAAPVSGAVVELPVQAGQRVRAGQLLVRVDARTAELDASAGQAQARAAQALLDVARKDFERQKLLFDKHYISQAALDRAAAQFDAAQAQANAQSAQAAAARTQSRLHVLRAPFAGVVADVPVALGDLALPGKPLVTLYQPGALRVAVALPQSLLGASDAGLKLEFADLPAAQRWHTPMPAQLQWLPTVDAVTHTVTLRIALPQGLEGPRPGLFARVWLSEAASEHSPRLFVPAAAVVRRAEVAGVYVVDAQGRAQLRQVRLGRAQGDRVEVLAGVSAGERVALDPQAAARAH